eukprot:TRINITY_DN8947_c0_g1_i7.p1 TRINITY_DN8947_c0_g1~~TRINITY_DN8947_c0_g1_i7.p1  ORF type:complete len:110 (+),score=1.09 TRINITY_DN8947_c0_g1_i7:436-765(+)
MTSTQHNLFPGHIIIILPLHLLITIHTTQSNVMEYKKSQSAPQKQFVFIRTLGISVFREHCCISIYANVRTCTPVHNTCMHQTHASVHTYIMQTCTVSKFMILIAARPP